jgi:hypothetical protein
MIRKLVQISFGNDGFKELLILGLFKEINI